MLSNMTSAPSANSIPATTISKVRVLAAGRSLLSCMGRPFSGGTRPAAVMRRDAGRWDVILLGEEARFLHQFTVTLLFLRHPIGILLAAEGGLVEGPALHEVLPLGRCADLIEQIDVVIALGVRHAAQIGRASCRERV